MAQFLGYEHKIKDFLIFYRMSEHEGGKCFGALPSEKTVLYFAQLYISADFSE